MSPISLSAQGSREELESRRKELAKQLKVTNKLLGETRNNRRAALDELLTLEAQMEQRQELIGILDNESKMLQNTIESHATAVVALERDLSKAREDCAQLVRMAWRQRNKTSLWMRLFNTPSIRDLWLRWRFLRRFFTYRTRQFAFLKNTRETISEKIDELNLRRQEYMERLGELEGQRNALSGEVNEKTSLVKKLKREENRLADEAKTIAANREKLNAMIEDVIRAEIAKAKERARQAAEKEKAERAKNNRNKDKTTPPPPANPPAANDELPMTPAESRLSASFRDNRGKLPWPVEQGVVTVRFGANKRPDLPKVEIKNNGIDIKTTGGATVYCVFEGRVAETFIIPGMQHAVIVQHGNYFTTYSNLGSVSVQKGQEIGTRSPIGTAYTNGSGVTEIHFEVWKDKVKQNPELWIKRK